MVDGRLSVHHSRTLWSPIRTRRWTRLTGSSVGCGTHAGACERASLSQSPPEPVVPEITEITLVALVRARDHGACRIRVRRA